MAQGYTGQGQVSFSPQVVTVSPDGTNDFTSVKAAMDSITDSSSTKRYVIRIYPGIFNENNPITGKDYVSIEWLGRHEAGYIQCINTGAHGLVCGKDVDYVGVQVRGASGVGFAGFHIPAGKEDVDIHDCKIRDCNIGILNEGGAVGEGIMVREFLVTGGTYATIIQSGANSNTHVLGLYVVSAVTITDSVLKCDGVGSGMEAFCCHSEAASVVNGIYSVNNGNLHVVGFRIVNATYGVRTGANGTIHGVSVDIGTSGTYDVWVEDSTGKVSIIGGKWRKDYVNCAAGSVCILAFGDDTIVGDEAFVIQAEAHVGHFLDGREFVAGEGDSYTFDMQVHQYDASAGSGLRFTSVTTAARSATGSAFAFPAPDATVGDALVIGVPRKFWGLKTNVLTALTHGGGGSITWEYWNGASWTAFTVMEVNYGSPFQTYADATFEQTGSKQIRFNDAIDTLWTADDDDLDDIPNYGSNHFCVRARVTATVLSVNPSFEQFKVHSSRSEINADGYLEFFGKARPKGNIPWDVNNFRAAGNSPINADFFVLNAAGGAVQDLSVGRIENSFEDATIDRSGLCVIAPAAMDTSCPLTIRIIWVPRATGDMEWHVNFGITRDGDTLATTIGGAPVTITAEQHLTAIQTVSAIDTQHFTEIEIDVSQVLVNKPSGGPDLLWISIARDSRVGNADDTIVGVVDVVQIAPQYTKWSDGEHQ